MDDVCCICLDRASTKSAVTLECCGARLHRLCITRYVLQDAQPRCMLCRAPLSPVLVRALESTAQGWLVRQTIRAALGAAVVRAAQLAAREIQDLIKPNKSSVRKWTELTKSMVS